MEPMFFVMAIMGCTDGDIACAQARVEPAHYATIQQCRAAMPSALARNSDLEFPVISAACRSAGMQMASAAGGKRG